MNIEILWDSIPIGSKNAISYGDLCRAWNCGKRSVRKILHRLSCIDTGDNFVLIRSSKNGGGFYKTDKINEILSFKNECLNKGRNIFAPLKKINRVLSNDMSRLQVNILNNLRQSRERLGLKQSDVVAQIKHPEAHIDIPMLSRFENGFCLPTPVQLKILSEIYKLEPEQLILTIDKPNDSNFEMEVK